MGITIHYRGKAKSLQAIDELVDMLTDIAQQSKWPYWLVEEEVKGKFSPSWGTGYGYIPSKEDIQKRGIEFFPEMVSEDCNGYFDIYDTKYAEEVRRCFRQGIWPIFRIDTKRKGIALNVHQDCESLEFSFDLKTLELANYETYDHSPGVVFGYNGFFCKTQYAGFATHVTVCRIIKLTERWVDYSSVYDEAGFYHTENMENAGKAFGESAAMIENMGKVLKELAQKYGFQVTVGGKV